MEDEEEEDCPREGDGVGLNDSSPTLKHRKTKQLLSGEDSKNRLKVSGGEVIFA